MMNRLLPTLLVILLIGCRYSDELVINLRAESEIDPQVHQYLTVLDFAYSGEIEFGELAAERVRDRLKAGGRFTIVRGMGIADPAPPLFNLIGEDLEEVLAAARELGADALLTGQVLYSRRDALDYSERLAESYDVEESRSPGMTFGRSWETDSRRTGMVFTLEISVRAYDTDTGEIIWSRSASERSETDSTNRTPTRSELMSVFNRLLYPVVEDLRLALEPHLRAETRYVIP